MATEIKSARDALEKIRDYILTGKHGDGCVAPILNWCDAALALPRMNCEVGTANEQSKRFDEFCDIHDCKSDCPLFKADGCELAWAQMPYEADKKGETDGD